MPGVPELQLRPNLVLVGVLPPLLYSGGFFTLLRDLRANARPIALLSIGLVAATMLGVAAVAHTAVPGLGWPEAFVLGAVVAPTDPIAATAIARRLGVPRRVVTVIEGEPRERRLGPRPLPGGRRGTGYLAYMPAQAAHVSGVLAAVTVGVYLGWRSPELSTPAMRMQGNAVWETLIFFVNALLFALVGLQLRPILDSLSGRTSWELARDALVVVATVPPCGSSGSIRPRTCRASCSGASASAIPTRPGRRRRRSRGWA